MSKLLGLLWAASHAAERRLLMPRRRRAWARKRAPFVHTARRGVSFGLKPGEYVDLHIYVEGLFERRFVDSLYAYFGRYPGDVMFDVGSNIGNHSCALAPRFRAVHAFDPNPIVSARMQANAARNGIGNLHLSTVGLGDAPATLHLKVNRSGNMGASFLTDERDADTMAVSVVVGDSYVREHVHGKVDFVKVDVEGHERAVFAGLRHTIARDRPIIAFEFHGSERPRGEFDAMAEMMPGYIFTDPQQSPAEASMLHKLRWHLQRCGRPLLQRFTTPQPRSYDNILAFPDEATLARFDAVYPRP